MDARDCARKANVTVKDVIMYHFVSEPLLGSSAI